MRFFRKKRSIAADNRLLAQLADSVNKRQMQLSGYLNRKTQYWNRASKLTALLLFCLLFGGGCLALLLKAII